MDAVRIIRDLETIKLLADLVRREILRLIAEEQGRSIEVRSSEIIELAQSIARRIVVIGEKYETIKMKMAENKWKDFFSRIGNLAPIKAAT